MAEPSRKTIRVGPGILYAAPLGTAEPATPTAALDPAWLRIGYTEQGSTWGIDLTVVRLRVEEEYEPVKTIVTERLTHMDANLAETDPAKLTIALNGGTTTTVAPFTKYEPPAVGDEVRTMLLWRSKVTPCDEQIVLRQALQTGNIAVRRTKQNLSVVNCKFDAELPDTGLPTFARWTLDSAFAA